METNEEDRLQAIVDSALDTRNVKLISEAEDCDNLLSLLDLNPNELIPRAGNLLTQMAEYKKLTDLQLLTPMAVYCWYMDVKMERMEYEVYNSSLKRGIDSIEKTIERDEIELECFKRCLQAEENKLNKTSAEECNRKKSSLENKILAFEGKLNELTNKLSKCKIPHEILPESIKSLEKEVDLLKCKRDELKTAVDNVNLAKSAKKSLMKLKHGTIHAKLNF